MGASADPKMWVQQVNLLGNAEYAALIARLPDRIRQSVTTMANRDGDPRTYAKAAIMLDTCPEVIRRHLYAAQRFVTGCDYIDIQVSERTLSRLWLAGVTTMAALTTLTPSEVGKLPGIGRGSLAEIEHGLSLKGLKLQQEGAENV